MGKYKLDYFAKYYFYEEDDFIKEDEGEFILNQIKTSNRFDYKGHSYKYTKYGNISKSDTKRDVDIEILENDINVLISGETKHLDLIYKFDIQYLEDHLRVTTRICEKVDDISCILYVKLDVAKDFLNELENTKRVQEEYMNQ